MEQIVKYCKIITSSLIFLRRKVVYLMTFLGYHFWKYNFIKNFFPMYLLLSFDACL